MPPPLSPAWEVTHERQWERAPLADELAALGALVVAIVRVEPTTIKAANAFVAVHHRHHKPVHAARFALCAVGDGEIHGVAIVGRPVARLLDDGLTAEVVRLATDGTPNACSMLYGACWRSWRAMGGQRMVTYILESEPGTSLRAAGWRDAGAAGGGEWDRPNRARQAALMPCLKRRYEVNA